MSPERVPIINPANGVNPIEVLIDSPFFIAQMEAPYSKVGDRSRGRLEGSIFNSYYTEVNGRTLLLSLD